MNAHQPLATKERVPIVDAFRGLALLGIILANVIVYPASISADVLIDSHHLNEEINAVLHVLISTNLLIGIGFLCPAGVDQPLVAALFFAWAY